MRLSPAPRQPRIRITNRVDVRKFDWRPASINRRLAVRTVSAVAAGAVPCVTDPRGRTTATARQSIWVSKILRLAARVSVPAGRHRGQRCQSGRQNGQQCGNRRAQPLKSHACGTKRTV